METTPAKAAAANPFWAFSWALYPKRGVADACLTLQEREGLDVNILLFCCWAGACGRRLHVTELRTLVATVADWQARVIAPLRAVRVWLKAESASGAPSGALPDVAVPAGTLPEVADLRAAIKDQELAAERVEQDMLHAALPLDMPHAALPLGNDTPAADIVADNLQAYFAASGRTPGPDDTAALAMLVLATCPDEAHGLDIVTRLDRAG